MKSFNTENELLCSRPPAKIHQMLNVNIVGVFHVYEHGSDGQDNVRGACTWCQWNVALRVKRK